VDVACLQQLGTIAVALPGGDTLHTHLEEAAKLRWRTSLITRWLSALDEAAISDGVDRDSGAANWAIALFGATIETCGEYRDPIFDVGYDGGVDLYWNIGEKHLTLHAYPGGRRGFLFATDGKEMKIRQSLYGNRTYLWPAGAIEKLDQMLRWVGA
jgi:hypothetical protein